MPISARRFLSAVLNPQAHIPSAVGLGNQSLHPPDTQQGTIAASISTSITFSVIIVPVVDALGNDIAVPMGLLFYIMETDIIEFIDD
ncbi:hypothetical protein BX616_002818 [Lobosporangium transversale]|nr:hypothetical protein BX616_002818 [Lobosporangium transversale]